VSVIDTSTESLAATINLPAGSDPNGVAVTPDGQFAYVADNGTASVSMINTSSDVVTAISGLGSKPYGVALTPNGSTLYVTNAGGTTVNAISTTSNAVIATITVGSNPSGVAVSPNGAFVYVTNTSSNTVSVITTNANTVADTINSGFNAPLGVQFTPDGSHAYVANASSSDSVSVITVATNIVTSSISVGASPTGVAVSPDGSAVYVTNENSNTVSVIDTETNTISDLVTVNVGVEPYGVAVTPDGSYAYVTNADAGTVSVIPTEFNIVQSPPLSGRADAGSAYTNQVDTSGNLGSVTFTTADTSPDVLVSPTGTVTASGSVPPGSYSVSGTDADPAGDLGNWAFTLVVVQPPAVTSVAPATGPVAGGTQVAIGGSHFDAGAGATTVMFGVTGGTNVSCSSTTSCTAMSPMGSAGTVDVLVTSDGVASTATGADHFTYLGPPAVTAVTPNTGPLAGGITVVVTGSGFVSGSTAVAFGADPATVLSCGASSCQVEAPPEATGPVDVSVMSPLGTSVDSSADTFTYLPVPAISGVTPSSGPVTGGTVVSLSGSGFTPGASVVRFGATPGTATSCASPIACTATSPVGVAGVVDVGVTTPNGGSASTADDHYSYLDIVPTLVSASVLSGPVVGGTRTTVVGTGFVPGSTVFSFGAAPATATTCPSTTSCSVTSPAGGVGPVELTVVTPGGPSATGIVFTYIALVVNPVPTAGPAPIPVPLVPSYRLAAADGGIFDGAGARFFGSTGSIRLNQPLVGMATTPDGNGYWLVAGDGGIFTFGDAGFYGSTGLLRLDAPIVGMVSTPDGRGYWLVASDGGIFTFGDAGFYGSTGALRLDAPIVGMASTVDGRGYYLVAGDGGVFTFGDAQFHGSAGGDRVVRPIVGMATDVASGGYWLVASDGGIFAFDAPFYGSGGGHPLNRPVVGMAASPDGAGYWLVATDGGVFSFGAAPFHGSAGSLRLNDPIVGMAAT
jgi:YVTN family beta-propeller protein